MRRKLSINYPRDDIHAFSKHSPARARAPDIGIAHTSAADYRCAARLSHATHTHAPVQMMMITAGVSMLCAQ